MDANPYILFMVCLTLFNLLIFATPFLAIYAPPLGSLIFYGFSFTCHQLSARSYCFYPADGSIGDCPYLYARGEILPSEKGPAYEFPVCARDIAIYLGAWISGIAVYFTKWKDAKYTPNPIYFILALIPIGLDGGTQLMGWRESTNDLRMLTGMIAGLAFSFYFVPMLNAILLRNEPKAFRKPTQEEKENAEKPKVKKK